MNYACNMSNKFHSLNWTPAAKRRLPKPVWKRLKHLQSDWEDWITRDRAEIARLTAEITQAEAEIDAIVYNLFDLTPDEIALLEASI